MIFTTFMLAKQPPRGMVMFDVYASDDDYRLGREFNYNRRVHGSGSQAYAEYRYSSALHS